MPISGTTSALCVPSSACGIKMLLTGGGGLDDRGPRPPGEGGTIHFPVSVTDCHSRTDFGHLGNPSIKPAQKADSHSVIRLQTCHEVLRGGYSGERRVFLYLSSC